MSKMAICERCGREFKLASLTRKVCPDCKPYAPRTKSVKPPVKGERIRMCLECQEDKNLDEFRRGQKHYQVCRSCYQAAQRKDKLNRWLSLIDLLGGSCSVCGYDKSEKALKVKLPNGVALRYNALFKNGPRGPHAPVDGNLICLNCLAEERDHEDPTG